VQARVHAGQRAAVGFVEPMRRGVGTGGGQPLQRGPGRSQQRRDRQLAAQQVDFVQVVVQHHARLRAKRGSHGLCADVRVAVAVAADPAAQAQERAAGRRGGGRVRAKAAGQVAVQRRHLGEEGGLPVRQRVADLVGHRELLRPQHACLPQGGDQRAEALAALLGRQFRAGAVVQQMGDRALGVQDALALHFGGVGGEHRHQAGVVQQGAGARCGDAAAGQQLHRLRQAAAQRLGRQPGAPQRAHLLLVFGQVGQMRKVGEGTHHADAGVAVELLQQPVKLAAVGRIAVAAKARGGLADLLDALEHRVALVVAQHTAEQAAQQADVVAQCGIGGRHGVATSGSRESGVGSRESRVGDWGSGFSASRAAGRGPECAAWRRPGKRDRAGRRLCCAGASRPHRAARHAERGSRLRRNYTR
jgi:hypothetical protein